MSVAEDVEPYRRARSVPWRDPAFRAEPAGPATTEENPPAEERRPSSTTRD